MNSYHPATSRTLVGVAAAFMSVATLAVAVLAPASLDSVSRDVSVASTSTAAQPTSANAGSAYHVDRRRRIAHDEARTRREHAHAVPPQSRKLTGELTVPHPSER